MKAGVFYQPRNFKIEDVPEPRVEPDGAVIKVKACGICGSDLHFYSGDRGRDGTILGHEFSGDVIEVGANVKGIKKGDRIVAMSGKGCGQCYWCKRGEVVRCQKLVLLGYGVPGAFAQYISVPLLKLGTYSARLPQNLTYEEGATAEPVSVALYAVNQAQPQPEDTVVVVGLGIIGLCIIQILKARRITQIIASGRRAKRLKLAEECGADVVVDAAREDVTAVSNKVTSGKGADIVFDVAGSTATFQQAMGMVHRGSKIELVGLYSQPISWNPTSIVNNDITLLGCGLHWDIPGAIDLLKSGKVNTSMLITHEFPLERIKDAFETQMSNADAIKVLVKP